MNLSRHFTQLHWLAPACEGPGMWFDREKQTLAEQSWWAVRIPNSASRSGLRRSKTCTLTMINTTPVLTLRLES